MSAPGFSLPDTCIPLSERKLSWAHFKRHSARIKRRIEERPDVPSGLAERCEGPNILPTFPGSWCEGNLPTLTRGRRPFCRRTVPPNLSWRHLSRPPSFCRSCPGARPVPSTDGSSKGLELQRRPGSPWNGGVRYAKHVEERQFSASTEWATCEADPAEQPKTLRPWGLASSEALCEGEGHRVWMKPRALIQAESITVPRNEIRWLEDSASLAKFTLSPRHSKWQSSTDLWDRSSSSDWAKMCQSSR